MKVEKEFIYIYILRTTYVNILTTVDTCKWAVCDDKSVKLNKTLNF